MVFLRPSEEISKSALISPVIIVIVTFFPSLLMIVNLYRCHLQRKRISQGEKNKDSNKNNEFTKKYDSSYEANCLCWKSDETKHNIRNK